jgi:hypothetical protein
MKIDPRIQATINRIVLRNLHRLDVTAAQRAAIVVALLAPRLPSRKRRKC